MNRMTALLALASVVSGCKADMPYLTHAEEVTSSQKCPAGGVVLTSGRDWSHDRVLDEVEVMERTEICNGVFRDSDGGLFGNNVAAGRDGVSMLINTVTLPFGDATCPNGGVLIETGVDEPADGGSGNGVLEPGEVRDSRFVCNGSAHPFVRSIEEPPGPKGQSVISANGGKTTSSPGTEGGRGGLINVEMRASSLGGNVKVFSTGAVDAGFEWPAESFEPGSMPWRVTDPIAVKSHASMGAGLASGEAYFVVTSSEKLMKRIDARTASEVTSVFIASTAALEISAINVTHDIRVEGSLSPSSSKLLLSAHRLSLSVGARVIETLDSALAVPSLEVRVDELVNQGTIEFPNQISIHPRRAFNRGVIRATGIAGTGGRIVMHAVDFASSGFIGVTSSSGSSGFVGGSISITTYGGPALISGELRAEGGSCTIDGCVGGRGGRINVTAYNGGIRMSAALSANAGRGIAKGGSGGAVCVLATSMRAIPSGSIQLSGLISVEGGSGAAGGDGGEVQILLEPVIARGQEIELFGFSTLMAKGGQGQLGGGSGGLVQFKTTSSGRDGALEGPSGAVVNSANIDVSGGDGDASQGGSISFQTSLKQAFVTSSELIRNSGSLVSNAGRASVIGGQGGAVVFLGAGRIENTGPIEATGVSGGERGVSGGRVELRSYDEVTNSGSIVVSGRAATKRGGAGGRVDFDGAHIENSAALIEANGGAGTVAGGDGGKIRLWSTLAGTRSTTGLEATPGLGATGGEAGSIVVY